MSDRHRFRADWHDYDEGLYFVTVCCLNMIHYFGEIRDGVMILSVIGEELDKRINMIQEIHSDCEVFNYVIMPNHIHLVLNIRDVSVGTRRGAFPEANHLQNCIDTIASADAPRRVPTLNISLYEETPSVKNVGCLKPAKDGSVCSNNHHNSLLAVVVNHLKGHVTKYSKQCNLPFKWQPRFHEHMIKSRGTFDKIMYYVDHNVANWKDDCFF